MAIWEADETKNSLQEVINQYEQRVKTNKYQQQLDDWYKSQLARPATAEQIKLQDLVLEMQKFHAKLNDLLMLHGRKMSGQGEKLTKAIDLARELVFILQEVREEISGLNDERSK